MDSFLTKVQTVINKMLRDFPESFSFTETEPDVWQVSIGGYHLLFEVLDIDGPSLFCEEQGLFVRGLQGDFVTEWATSKVYEIIAKELDTRD